MAESPMPGSGQGRISPGSWAASSPPIPSPGVPDMRRPFAALVLAVSALPACAAPVAPQDEPRPAAYFVSGPDVGQRAPLFTLDGATREGPLSAPFDLALQRGRVTVLAFYPRDFTSGCTAEFQTFRDRGAELFGEGVTVVGLSVDSVSTHVRFAESIGHPYALLSDT